MALISAALATRPPPRCAIAHHLAAAGGMPYVDRILEVEVLHQSRGVRGVGVHVVPAVGLARPSVAAPVVGDDAVPLARKNIIWLSQSSA